MSARTNLSKLNIQLLDLGPGNVETVAKLVLDIKNAFDNDNSSSQTVSKAKVWILSASKFAGDLLSTEVAGYPDLVVPIMEAISR